MAHDRPALARVMQRNFGLELGVGMGDAAVLAQVFRPGGDDEPFDQQVRVGRVLRDPQP